MPNQIATMSAAFLAAMTKDVLNICTYGEIWSGLGQAKLYGPLLVTDGNVVIDDGNAVRRQANTVTLVDPTGLLTPEQAGSLLYPDGNELFLFKGVNYSPGSRNATTGLPTSYEVAQLGCFLMEDVDIIDQNGGLTIVLTGLDRMETISRAKFTAPYATDGTSTLDVAIAAMLAAQVPGLTYSFMPTTYVPPVATYQAGDDPSVGAIALATAAGFELFLDYNGIVVLQPIPNPNTKATCAFYNEGQNCIVTYGDRKLSNTQIPNVIIVVASGSGVSVPIQTFWWDNDPTSPTFYALGTPGATLPARSALSTYPTTVQRIDTSSATTLGQAQSIANAAGLALRGAIETLDFKIRDNPAHDAEDVVEVTRARMGIPSGTRYVLDKVTIQLGLSTELEAVGRLVVA